MEFIVNNMWVWLIMGVLLEGAGIFFMVQFTKNENKLSIRARMAAFGICALLGGVSLLLFIIAVVKNLIS